MAHSDDGARGARIDLRGLSVYTHHGVTDAEQEVGQRLELDVSLELARPAAAETDELAGTVDYAAVAQLVLETATESRYRTLERLTAVIGERLVERFGVGAATVRAAKPEPPMGVAIGSVSVTLTTRRAS